MKITFNNGGSTDPKCPPGVFGLRLVPFSTGTGPTAQLVITNKGPHDVPAGTLKKIRVNANTNESISQGSAKPAHGQ